MSEPADDADPLRISEERHRLLAEQANDVIWTMGLDGSITYVSPAVERMRGITQAEAMSQTLDQIHPPESQAVSLAYFTRLYERMAAGLAPEEFRGELEYYRKDGSTVWTEVQVIPHIAPDGQVVEILGVTRDISDRKRHEEELRQAREEAEAANRALTEVNLELMRLATTDALTGAWNRRQFELVAAVEVAKAQRYGQSMSLLMLDVDRFKAVNDEHGHLVGDQVLVELVERIGSRLRESDVLARWGGEEFIVLMPHATVDDAMALAESLRLLVSSTAMAKDGTVTCSIGVAEYVVGESMDAWLSRADRALYEAKASGRNAVRSA